MAHRSNNPDEKWCTLGQHFALKSEFGTNNTKSDGLQGSCRIHTNERGKAHWLVRREERTGMNNNEYQTLYQQQQGRCATCGNHNKGGRALCADHDHETGQIRRLLCDDCNRAIGFIHDDPQVAQNIADYLREFRS